MFDSNLFKGSVKKGRRLGRRGDTRLVFKCEFSVSRLQVVLTESGSNFKEQLVKALENPRDPGIIHQYHFYLDAFVCEERTGVQPRPDGDHFAGP